MEIRDYAIIFGNDSRVRTNLFLSKLVTSYLNGTKIEYYDLELIRDTRIQTKKHVIADWKLSAIGFYDKTKNKWTGTMSKHIRTLKRTWADYVTVQLFPGIGSKEAVKIAHKGNYKMRVLGLVDMTQKYAKFTFKHPLDKRYVKNVAKECGIESLEDRINECKTISDFLLIMGEDVYGVDGYIGLANDIDSLKRLRGFTDKTIFATGLGRQSEIPVKEQMRKVYDICGKKSAVIVATYIYRSRDPLERVKQLRQWREEMVGG